MAAFTGRLLRRTKTRPVRDYRRGPRRLDSFRFVSPSTGGPMLQSVRCRCEVCFVEGKLQKELETESRILQFRELCRRDPELSRHPSPSALVAHIHELKHVNGSAQHSDRLLSSLRNLALGRTGHIAEHILVLAFIPALHATVTAVTSGFPGIARSDVAQQGFASLIGLLQMREWLNRRTHLAFALARELRRALFLWAKNERRSGFEPQAHLADEMSISSAELFEDDVTLKHFLFRSVQVGALSADDLDLLIHFKREGDFRNGTSEAASNAFRQKMKRLVSKMRRRAAYKVAGSPKPSHSPKKARHVF